MADEVGVSIRRQNIPVHLLQERRTGTMSMAADSMKTMTADLLSAYDQGVKNITPLFSIVALSLDVNNNDEEVEKQQLRETLSRKGNLRKKDFDRMMTAITDPGNNHSRESRLLLQEFLKGQQAMLEQLGGHFAQIRNHMETGDMGRIAPAVARVKEIIGHQERARKELESDLAEQEKGQQEIQTGMKSLLKKGREVEIRDFKEMLAGIQRQSKIRNQQNRSRRETISRLLADYKEQRLKNESIRSLQ
ncbi:MAG: hypothetical protein HY343_12940 [Lentisphaerae bacterium]|nr:hypothetical protein [Lentisphaerota bacterium]